LALLLNAQSVSKSFGATMLFREVSFTVNEGDRIGLIGPNGSGKSTLLKMLAGEIDPDSGQVTPRKNLRMAYVEQDSQFPAGATVRTIIEAALQRARVPEPDWEQRLRATL
jgi:ATP-binding cassette subfamily F protein uup